MNKYKNKILNTLNNEHQINNTIENLSKIQENLLKNHSNPVFNSKDKNKLLQNHIEIENLGKTLYRYKTLSNNNISSATDSEKENIYNLVLNGGISNIRYIWHSENSASTCEECAALNGTEYSFEDEVPARPHPNCKCYVEIVEDDEEEPGNGNGGKKDEDEEPCDCLVEIEHCISLLKETEIVNQTIAEEFENERRTLEQIKLSIEKAIVLKKHMQVALENDYQQHLDTCKNNIDDIYEDNISTIETLQSLFSEVANLIEVTANYIQVLWHFATNYTLLLFEAYVLKEEAIDKYRHGVANCQSAQVSQLGSEIATLLSDEKEMFDQKHYVETHRVTIEEAMADSAEDQAVNAIGRLRGTKNPTCDCRILMQDLLPERYRK